MNIMYFEDIEVGQKRFKSATYQVKKEEIIEFARHWDPISFHIDEAAAVSSVFGGLVACSAHIFSILSWFATHGKRRTASMAALGFDEHFVCAILFDQTTRSLARLHTLKNTSPDPRKTEGLYKPWHHYPISKV